MYQVTNYQKDIDGAQQKMGSLSVSKVFVDVLHQVNEADWDSESIDLAAHANVNND